MHGFRQRRGNGKVLGLVISVLVILLAAGCDGEAQTTSDAKHSLHTH